MIGETEFIAQSFASAQTIAHQLGVPVAFAEQADIRSTFAVPTGEAARLANAFYDAFAAP